LREYHADQEEEAYGVGAATLLPWAQFYHFLDTGIGVSKIAEEFDVTEDLVAYRIKITGATNLYRNRCRYHRKVSARSHAATRPRSWSA
jgi:hypothetical protein